MKLWPLFLLYSKLLGFLCKGREEFWTKHAKSLIPNSDQTVDPRNPQIHYYRYKHKYIVRKIYGTSNKAQEKATREIETLEMMAKTKGIVKFYTCMEDSKGISIFLEQLGRDLSQELLTFQGFEWPKKLRMALELVQTLEHIHALKIIHGDVKPDNMALTLDGESVKLFDFDGSVRINQPWRSFSDFYVAPEIYELGEDKAKPSQDAWSLAVTIFELFFTNFCLKLSAANDKKPVKVISARLRSMVRLQLQWASNYHKLPFYDVMKNWLRSDVTKRATLEQMEEGLLTLLEAALKREKNQITKSVQPSKVFVIPTVKKGNHLVQYK